MSVTVEASSISYDGNDVADEFAVPFKFLETNDLLVRTTDDDGATYTTLTYQVDYTVDGVGEDEGGTLITEDPVATGTSLVIERNTNITQASDFSATQGAFPVARHEAAFDKLTLVCQELARRVTALEALDSLLDVSDVSVGNSIEHEFLTLDTVEETFPISLTCADGNTVTDAWCTYLSNTDDPSETFDECPAIQWSPGGPESIILVRADGLKPNTNYLIRLLVMRNL